MSKKIKPLGSRVVIQRTSANASKGGILLPESAQEKPRLGKVVAVGPGKTDENGRLHPLNVSVGDEVYFASYAGTEYKSGGEEFLILSEEDLLAVLGG